VKLLWFVVLLSAAACAQSLDPLHLTLAEAEKLAIQNNPRFTSARFTAEAAAQAPLEYSAAYQPTLLGSVTGVGADSGSRLAAGALNNPVVYNRLGSGLAVNQLITDFGRTGNLIQSAKFRALAQNQITETTRAQILLETDRDYFNVLRARSVLRVARETVAARQLVADQVSALARGQLKSTLDVTFANVNLADARLQLAGAENEARGAVAELATSLGIPAQTDFVLTEEPMPDNLPDSVGPLIQEAIEKRPELADLRLELEASRHFAQAERALMFPSIGVTAAAGFVPAGQSVVPGRYGAAGVNVNIPIFNGGLFKARRNEAEFRARAAAENVKDLENRVVRDVRVAFLNASTAYERVALTAQLVAQARQALDLAQARYNLGLGTIVELSQAQLNVTSAEIAGASAKYDYQALRSALEYQVGALR
jgi:outer membrane protein